MEMRGAELTDEARRALRYAGLAVWAGVGIVLPFCDRSVRDVPLTLAAYLCFAGAFWRLTGKPPGLARTLALLCIEAAASLVLIGLHPYYVAANLLAVGGWQAALLLPAPAAIVWIVVQTLLPTVLISPNLPSPFLLAYFLAVIGFQLFGVVTAVIARREAAGRALLAAAQARLAASARDEERLRIARNLHDTTGHRLTAMMMQLDLAAKGPAAQSGARIDAARAEAACLLAETRATVSQMRHDAGAETLGDALAAIAAGSEHPCVRLEMSAACAALTGAAAEAVTRMVQEALTNARRHAGADEMIVRIALTGVDYVVEIRDNGRGSSLIVPGSGLRGMAERIRALGGQFSVTSAPGDGTLLQAHWPAGVGAA